MEQEAAAYLIEVVAVTAGVALLSYIIVNIREWYIELRKIL